MIQDVVYGREIITDEIVDANGREYPIIIVINYEEYEDLHCGWVCRIIDYSFRVNARQEGELINDYFFVEESHLVESVQELIRLHLNMKNVEFESNPNLK